MTDPFETATADAPPVVDLAKFLQTWTDDPCRQRDFYTALRTCPLQQHWEILADPRVSPVRAAADALGILEATDDFIVDTVLGVWQTLFLRDANRDSWRADFLASVEAMKMPRHCEAA